MSEFYAGALPDFSDISSTNDPEEIKWRFYNAAKKIMLEYDLVCGNIDRQITALELYLYHPELWPDESTDRDSEDVQLERGRWYVTKAAPKRRRIDITAGVKPTVYAGLLIAAVEQDDGCGCALNTILHGDRKPRLWNYCEDAETIKKIHNSPADSASSFVWLRKRLEPRRGNFFIGIRKNPPRTSERFKRDHLRIAIDPPCTTWKSHTSLNMTELRCASAR